MRPDFAIFAKKKYSPLEEGFCRGFCRFFAVLWWYLCGAFVVKGVRNVVRCTTFFPDEKPANFFNFIFWFPVLGI